MPYKKKSRLTHRKRHTAKTDPPVNKQERKRGRKSKKTDPLVVKKERKKLHVVPIKQEVKEELHNLKSVQRRNSKPFHCSNSTTWYKCAGCSYQTQLWLNFNKHRTGNKSLPDFCRVFRCDYCKFETCSKLVLTKHVYDKCTVRNRTFCLGSKHKEYMKCHRFLRCIPYDNINWLKCEHCTYMREIRGDLRRHMVVHHTNTNKNFINWFDCELCLYNVEQISKLKGHILGVHEGMKYYE